MQPGSTVNAANRRVAIGGAYVDGADGMLVSFIDVIGNLSAFPTGQKSTELTINSAWVLPNSISIAGLNEILHRAVFDHADTGLTRIQATRRDHVGYVELDIRAAPQPPHGVESIGTSGDARPTVLLRRGADRGCFRGTSGDDRGLGHLEKRLQVRPMAG